MTKTPFARRVEIYFSTLTSVLKNDPKRLRGVVQYATDPDNIEGQIITISVTAQKLLKDAVELAERQQYESALGMIDKAADRVYEDLQADSNLYLRAPNRALIAAL